MSTIGQERTLLSARFPGYALWAGSLRAASPVTAPTDQRQRRLCSEPPSSAPAHSRPGPRQTGRRIQPGWDSV